MTCRHATHRIKRAIAAFSSGSAVVGWIASCNASRKISATAGKLI
jgi:hypothetical protein